MEGTLLVTPAELQNTANTFQGKAGEVKSLHDDMMGKVTTLCGSWTGDASNAYKSKFTSLQASMDKINRMILEHVNDLNTMAEQYETAENAAKSAASELPASTLD
ncbi:WXG100 family type VII secretion target [Hominisplanchenecus sp.]|jgi:WXG100 family type VII secretion target|uniref:WXG100 family type VII secretion target n=1 Tax=Hominisplanchenecus sp. TaxID=3038130 RepID=UPI0039926871